MIEGTARDEGENTKSDSQKSWKLMRSPTAKEADMPKLAKPTFKTEVRGNRDTSEKYSDPDLRLATSSYEKTTAFTLRDTVETGSGGGPHG
jgi:hypothetical protein